jgi:hypothetical protein
VVALKHVTTTFNPTCNRVALGMVLDVLQTSADSIKKSAQWPGCASFLWRSISFPISRIALTVACAIATSDAANAPTASLAAGPSNAATAASSTMICFQNESIHNAWHNSFERDTVM